MSKVQRLLINLEMFRTQVLEADIEHWTLDFGLAFNLAAGHLSLR
jgi:hypothetical protein